jgi:outer membrane murein-binding lipoprotein Lpp
MLKTFSLQRAFRLGALTATLPLMLLSGCAADSAAEETSTQEEDLTAANADYDATLSDVDQMLERCQADGNCEPSPTDAIVPMSNLTLGQGLRPLAGPTLGSRFSSLKSLSLCTALRPMAALQNPYFFVGGSAKAAALKSADVGVDLVFDLSHQQAALFHYKSHGYQNLIGAQVSAYLGYGFGRKANVLEAWSGDFQTAEATVETPFLKISAGGAIFRSPDNSVWGGLVEASFGFNALGPVSTVEVSVSEGFWTPWDGATRAFGKSLYFAKSTEKSVYLSANRKQHAYLQFEGTRAFSFALVQRLGALGFLPAAQAVGLDVLKRKGLTIERMCGR